MLEETLITIGFFVTLAAIILVTRKVCDMVQNHIANYKQQKEKRFETMLEEKHKILQEQSRLAYEELKFNDLNVKPNNKVINTYYNW